MLVLGAVAAYHNTFQVPFFLDDTLAIVDNPTIRDLGDLRHVLAPDVGHGITVSGRPLLNLSLALCYAVSGTSVWSYHALNLLIHILAGLTLFGLVRRTAMLHWHDAAQYGVFAIASVSDSVIARAPGAGALSSRFRNPTVFAFAVALLWTLHPLQTEAVTYVIQRAESLMGLFFLLTFYGFIRSVASPRPGIWRILAVLSCLAGVETKEVAATAPLLVFLYDRTFVAGTFREAWRQRRWLHLSLAATWIPLALLVAGAGWNRGGTAGFNVGASAWGYWCTQFEAIVRYLRLSLWPHPLIFEYGKFWMGLGQAAPFAVIVLPLLGATVVALWRWPLAGFLGAWFFVILAPTSLVPGTLQMIVEHRMYLPLAAIVVGVVFGLEAAVGRIGKWLPVTRTVTEQSAGPTGDLANPGDDVADSDESDGGTRGRPRPATFTTAVRHVSPLLGVTMALPLGLLTFERNQDYRDDLVLWQRTVEQRPESALAQDSLGTALYERDRVSEAMPHYLTALRLDPDLVSNRYNLGLAYAKLGRLPEAEVHYRHAVHVNPLFYPGWYQLGLALLEMNRPQDAMPMFAETAKLNPTMAEARYEWGVALAKAGRETEAVEQYRAALRLKPDFVAAECDLGSALLRLDQTEEATACFRRALRRNPTLADVHFNLGLALARAGAAHDALAEYAEAVRLNPQNAKAQYNLGLALGRAGQVQDAITHLKTVIQLEPEFADAHCNLAVALAMTGRLSEAVDEYRAALHFRPDYATAHHGLGMVLLQLGRATEARQHFEAALRIDPQFTAARAMLDRLRNAER